MTLSRLVIIAPLAVRDRSLGPRRYMDTSPLPQSQSTTAIIAQWFDNDEALEQQFYERRSPTQRLLAAAHLLITHRHSLRAATIIYCLDGIHFEALMLLARLRLISTTGKRIVRHSFHNRSLESMRARLAAAPPAFIVEVITTEQHTRYAQQHTPGRIQHRPWAIDLDWYSQRTSAPTATAPLLIPGNVHRDESLVTALLHQSPSAPAIIRAGRSQSLSKTYASLAADPRFQLLINATHSQYRDTLHSAAAILLPIVPCDEPAGLTAAMEAIATGVPMLANHSIGIAELHATTQYPIPLLRDLHPSTWQQAISQLRQRLDSQDQALQSALAQSRHLLAAHHSIRPQGMDWQHLLETYATMSSPVTP